MDVVSAQNGTGHYGIGEHGRLDRDMEFKRGINDTLEALLDTRSMKLIWTSVSAAKELGISKRHLVRYVENTPDLQECLKDHKGTGIYVFAAQHMERLRELVRVGPTGRSQRGQRRKTYERRA